MLLPGYRPTALQIQEHFSKFGRLLHRNGVVAQLGERSVRNAEVEGSIPFNSTKSPQVDFTPHRAEFSWKVMGCFIGLA